MFTSVLGASNTRDGIVRLLLALLASWAAAFAYTSLLAKYAVARFWEPWVASGSSIVIWAPLVLIGVIAGAVLGIALALIFRAHSLRVAAVAALLQFLPSIFLGDALSAVLVGVGLLAGAAVIGLFRRA